MVGVHLYEDFFLNTTVAHDLWLAEFVDVKPQIWRNCGQEGISDFFDYTEGWHLKFLTTLRAGISNSTLLKGQL